MDVNNLISSLIDYRAAACSYNNQIQALQARVAGLENQNKAQQQLIEIERQKAGFHQQCMLALIRHISPLENQRTNGPVNAHLIPWPSKAQNIQNLENIW